MKFELYLFTADAQKGAAALSAGADAVVIDWENRGKAERQIGADTQINYDTPEDLRRLRAATGGRLVVRINGFGPHTASEVENAIDGGADELLLPMARTTSEAESYLKLVNGRRPAGMLVETREAVEVARELGRLPLSRVYVGLNDLMISLGNDYLFTTLIDGTVERIREHFAVPFGVAGLTVPEGGSPIACRLLAGELARLRCSFSFLRRSFWADMEGRQIDVEIRRIRAMLEAARRRDTATIEHEHNELRRAVEMARVRAA